MKKLILFSLISTSVILFSTDSFSQITSKNSGNWNSPSTWNGGAVPGSSSQVIISDGHTVTINTNAVCRNLTIGQGGVNSATLKFDGNTRSLSVTGSISGYIYISSNGVLTSTSGVNQTIYIAGDLTNLGTFTQGANNTVNFNGGSLRNILGSNIVFNNLTINKTGGLNLATNVTVDNTLTLTSGLIYTLNDTLTVNGNISVASPGATKMIVLDDGTNFGRLKLKTASNKSYTFPIGDTRGTDEYSPVTINLTSGANSSAYIAVNMKNQKDANNTSTMNYLKRAWTVFPSGLNSFAYNITINYLNADVTGTENLLYFAKYDEGVWTILGQPNTTSNIFTTSGLTSFSTFTGGEQGSLPVSLQSLYSTVSGRNVTISWITTSENNNKGFDVLRASLDKNGVIGNFETEGFVKGSGTTTQQKSYNFTDDNLNTGKYKYRLKQIDNNGNYEYFDLNAYIEIGLPNKYSVSQNYPNPFNPTTKIDFELPADSKVSMVIFDISGREVAKVLNNEFRNAGFHTADFNAGKFSSGIYFYRLTAENFSVTKKMMLVK
ncbi:MAG: T9SS type A sorting domain-containing protein [Ignavibacteria bacterium]|jgi:hypothetical protein